MAEAKELEIGARNDPLGLSERSLINLDIIERTFAETGRGHVVTQLVQSLLALVVFPKERQFGSLLRQWTLESIERHPEWPSIRPEIDEYEAKTISLSEVLWHMRNAICHSRVIFYGKYQKGPNSRFVDDVEIEFSDQNKKGHKWRLRMGAADVRKLCLLLDEVIRDP